MVENAIRYNRVGGTVAVTTGTVGAGAFLRITNTGQQITVDEVDGLFEPFVRGAGNRTRADGGAGLGLSIVRAVVIAHHGVISSTALPTGGLDITVDFPSMPSAGSSPS